MPPLKQIACSIELGSGNAALKEYGARYSDGHVETFIAVPDTDMPFTIYLKTEGYIAPGIAFFVYMDGEYQCNRNRICLKLPGEGVPASEYEAEFRLRQKEEKTTQGTFVVRDWTFAKLNRVAADKAPSLNPQFMNNVGTIEIVALRCKPDTEGLPPRLTLTQAKQAKPSTTKTAKRAPSAPSVKQQESEGGGMLGSMMGIFDGAGDDIDTAEYEHEVWDRTVSDEDTDSPPPTPPVTRSGRVLEIESAPDMTWDSIMGEWKSELPHAAHAERSDSRSDVINQARLLEPDTEEELVSNFKSQMPVPHPWSGRGRNDMRSNKYLGMTGVLKGEYRQLLREEGNMVSDSTAASQSTDRQNTPITYRPALANFQSEVEADEAYRQRFTALLRDDAALYEPGEPGEQRFRRDVMLHEKNIREAHSHLEKDDLWAQLDVVKQKWNTIRIINETFLNSVKSLNLQDHPSDSHTQTHTQALRASARLPKPKWYISEEEARPLADLEGWETLAECQDPRVYRLKERLIDVEVQRTTLMDLWSLMPYDNLSWVLQYLGKEQRAILQDPHLLQPIVHTVAELEVSIDEIRARESVLYRFFGWLKQLKNDFHSKTFDERLEEIEDYRLSRQDDIKKLLAQDGNAKARQAKIEAANTKLAEEAKRDELAQNALNCGDAPANSRQDDFDQVPPRWTRGWAPMGTGTLNAGQQYTQHGSDTRYVNAMGEDLTDRLNPQQKLAWQRQYGRMQQGPPLAARVGTYEYQQMMNKEQQMMNATPIHPPGIMKKKQNEDAEFRRKWDGLDEQSKKTRDATAQAKAQNNLNDWNSDGSVTPPGMVRTTEADGIHNPLFQERLKHMDEEIAKMEKQRQRDLANTPTAKGNFNHASPMHANWTGLQPNVAALHPMLQRPGWNQQQNGLNNAYGYQPRFHNNAWEMQQNAYKNALGQQQNAQYNSLNQQQPVQNNAWNQQQTAQNNGWNQQQTAQNNGWNQQQTTENNGWDQAPTNNNVNQSGGWGVQQNNSKQNNGWGSQQSNKQQSGGWGGQDNRDQQNDAWDRQSQGSKRSNDWDRQSKESKQSGGWGNNNGKPGSVKSEASWGGKSQSNNGGGNGWGDKVSQSGSSHHSQPASYHRRSSRPVEDADPKSHIKPYWNDWNKPPQSSDTPGLGAKKHEEPRNAYTYPASPLPPVPSSKAKDASHGIQAGRGADYSHKCRQPIYIDSMEKPYAVFSYKYRSKDVLEKILKRKIDGLEVKKIEEQAQKDKYAGMPKHKLVEELMQKRGVPSKNEKNGGHGNGGWGQDSNKSASVKDGWASDHGGSAKGGWSGDNNNNGGGTGWGEDAGGAGNWGGDGDRGSGSLNAGAGDHFVNEVAQHADNGSAPVAPNDATVSPTFQGPPPWWGTRYPGYMNAPIAGNFLNNAAYMPGMPAAHTWNNDNVYTGNAGASAPDFDPEWNYSGPSHPVMPSATPKKTKQVAFNSAANAEIPGRELTPEHFGSQGGGGLCDTSNYFQQGGAGFQPMGPQRSMNLLGTAPDGRKFMAPPGYKPGGTPTKMGPVGPKRPLDHGPLNAPRTDAGAAVTKKEEDDDPDDMWF